ncbi:MAG TPA: M50 family metallopeptidase [Clostridia bacterium]|nr:M50 family metallopeptidase [Clostridia bacterium]
MLIEVKRSVLWFFVAMAFTSALNIGWPNGIWAAVLITPCVLLHEVGHASLAHLLGVPVSRIGICAKGGYTVRKRSPRPSSELLITFAGPAMNLLLFAVFSRIPNKLTLWVALCNLVLAVANLVPIGPSDGLRLARTISTMLRRQA